MTKLAGLLAVAGIAVLTACGAASPTAHRTPTVTAHRLEAAFRRSGVKLAVLHGGHGDATAYRMQGGLGTLNLYRSARAAIAHGGKRYLNVIVTLSRRATHAERRKVALALHAVLASSGGDGRFSHTGPSQFPPPS
jgi:hypothetical protein